MPKKKLYRSFRRFNVKWHRILPSSSKFQSKSDMAGGNLLQLFELSINDQDLKLKTNRALNIAKSDAINLFCGVIILIADKEMKTLFVLQDNYSSR